MMGARAGEDRARAVFSLDPFYLACNDIKGLVPTDAHIFGGSPVLAVPVAVRIEIDPLHGIQKALWRINQ